MMSSNSSSNSCSSSAGSYCQLVEYLPSELHLSILTYLRAIDLSAIQRTCRTFNNRTLIEEVIHHTATVVYPPELTNGFDTPIIGGEVALTTQQKLFLTYESLRNMEMLVVARVLSRPEPSLRRGEAGFYISKSWCRTALRWLEVRQEERREREQQLALSHCNQSHPNGHHNGHHNNQHSGHGSSKKKKQKKLSKKQQRLRDRIKSDALPPWPNVNDDIICEHSELRHCSSKSARARRRIMDKQAWKILKKLYPDSIQLESRMGECLQCALEAETVKRQEMDQKERERVERKRPLSCPLVRAFYTRSRGVPLHSLKPSSSVDSNDEHKAKKPPPPATTSSSSCPLLPGIYHALPRSWCHRWRKYLKTGEGDPTPPPDASACLCDAHKLPLVPPHLDAFLRGKTTALLSSIGSSYVEEGAGYGTAAAAGFCGECSSPTPAAAGTAPSATGTTPTKKADAASFSRSPSSSRKNIPAIERFQPDDDNQDNQDMPSQNMKKEQEDIINALRAAGLSQEDLQSQRIAMMNMEETNKKRQQHYAASTSPIAATLSSPHPHAAASPSVATTATIPQSPASPQINESVNQRLDKENRVVVEILTDEEFVALERWWPEIHSNYALRFAITTDNSSSSGGSDVVWSTLPCQNCDATGRIHNVTMKKRSKRWDKKR